MLAHADRKDNPCGLCGKTFTTAPELKAHLRVHEEDDVKYTHCCELCGKRYALSLCKHSCSTNHFFSQLNFWLIISLFPSLDLLNVPTWMLTCGFIPDINHIHATTAAKLFHRKGTWKSIDGFTRVKNHLCANSVVSVLITIQFKPHSNVK